MTETRTALDVALGYFEAWTGKDIDRAMSYIADDIVCEAPAGRIEGAAAYREFIAPFAGTLLGSELFAAFGDQTTAIVMYDTRTPVADSAPGAELVTVADGKITHSRFVFDRLPFELARRAGV
jgi:ketosteroid isomerase-like protein